MERDGILSSMNLAYSGYPETIPQLTTTPLYRGITEPAPCSIEVSFTPTPVHTELGKPVNDLRSCFPPYLLRNAND